MKKLYRSRSDKVIGGVCGGLAEYLGIDSSIIRLITLALIFVGGVSIWIYIIAALVIPLEPKDPEDAENYYKEIEKTNNFGGSNNDNDFY